MRDYTALVQQLIETHPIDEAMEIAVGGSYETAGLQIVNMLKAAGLNNDMSIVDLGCGSGRVSHRLGLEFDNLEYLGIDIVQSLLDYAATKSPSHFRFILNESLFLPVSDNFADMFIAFSVFTHLLHEESFLYLREAKRVVKPGGIMLITFLESERNWPIFEGMLNDSQHANRKLHLNMIIERSQMIDWARRLELQVVNFDLGGPHDGHGQTVAWLRRHE